MEKISNILPASPRIKSVDLDEAHPVRPGAPSLGNPVGTTASIRDKVKFSSLAKEAAFKEPEHHNSIEEGRAQVVKELSKKFFETRLEPKALSEQLSDQEVEISDAVAMPNLSKESGQSLNKYA